MFILASNNVDNGVILDSLDFDLARLARAQAARGQRDPLRVVQDFIRMVLITVLDNPCIFLPFGPFFNKKALIIFCFIYR